MVIFTKKAPFPKLSFSMNYQMIERVSSVKFLVIYICDSYIGMVTSTKTIDYI